ncbi:unnamed protein product [Haemonchus placei]|uniref:Meis_PKNOX_N domain-containing protein n=1 Tax=Haemonchus placei TaxID=6290 RepID=A0A0N4WD37_HAEPC|nr:unnamed protein product [Haemonchus placei]
MFFQPQPQAELFVAFSGVGWLFEKLEAKGVSTNTGNEKLDKFMRDAVLVIRTHLFELQKVASLADDFYTKYLQALRRRISHEVLIGVSGDSDDDLTEPNQNDEVTKSQQSGNSPTQNPLETSKKRTSNCRRNKKSHIL